MSAYELAGLIHGHDRTVNPYPIADAILAAGYSKPRTITSIEELDALPDGAVLMGDWATYQRVFGEWVTLGGPSVTDVDLPATVLYTPKES